MNEQISQTTPNGELSSSLFHNRNFILLWIARAVSVLGDNIYTIALMWWVREKTGSTIMMATVAICWTVPAIVLGPIAGTYADRVNRKRLLVWMDLGRVFLISIPATLLLFNLLAIWHVFVITILESVMAVLFAPSLAAFLPSLVRKEDLTRANSTTQLSLSVSTILGGALGGMLYAAVGVAITVYLDALSFFISGLAVILISVKALPLQSPTERKNFFRDLKDGLIYIRQNQFIWGIMLLFAVSNFFLAPINIYIPVMVKDVLRMGPQGFGYLVAAFFSGTLLGNLLLSIKGQVKRKGLVIVTAISLTGLGFAFFGISSYFSLSALLLCLTGAIFSFSNVLTNVVFQSQIPSQIQGRVFGALYTIAQSLMPLSYALAGVLSELFKVQAVIFVSGILAFFIGIYGFFIKGIRDA